MCTRCSYCFVDKKDELKSYRLHFSLSGLIQVGLQNAYEYVSTINRDSSALQPRPPVIDGFKDNSKYFAHLQHTSEMVNEIYRQRRAGFT